MSSLIGTRRRNKRWAVKPWMFAALRRVGAIARIPGKVPRKSFSNVDFPTPPPPDTIMNSCFSCSPCSRSAACRMTISATAICVPCGSRSFWVTATASLVFVSDVGGGWVEGGDSVFERKSVPTPATRAVCLRFRGEEVTSSSRGISCAPPPARPIEDSRVSCRRMGIECCCKYSRTWGSVTGI